jgi:hypothetical protein
MPFATPEKKEKPSAKRRLLFTEEESPEKKRKVPIVADVVSPSTSSTLVETPKKKTRRGRRIIVTPDKEEGNIGTEAKIAEQKEEYVPAYIHKNLSYQRRGKASLTDKVQQTFDLIETHFTIPSDFEQNRKYGPISGSCYEERTIQAYTLSLLEPIKPENASVEICSECAIIGHNRMDCPKLI